MLYEALLIISSSSSTGGGKGYLNTDQVRTCSIYTLGVMGISFASPAQTIFAGDTCAMRQSLVYFHTREDETIGKQSKVRHNAATDWKKKERKEKKRRENSPS